MQTIVLALGIVMLTTIAGSGQCNRKVNWHAVKAELLDANGQVLDTREGNILLATDKSTVMLRIKDGPKQSIEAAITESSCEWKEAFKNGRTVYKADLKNAPAGTEDNGTFTIEAKDGKVTIFMELDQMQGKIIRIPVEKYEPADNDLPVPRSIIDISTI